MLRGPAPWQGYLWGSLIDAGGLLGRHCYRKLAAVESRGTQLLAEASCQPAAQQVMRFDTYCLADACCISRMGHQQNDASAEWRIVRACTDLAVMLPCHCMQCKRGYIFDMLGPGGIAPGRSHITVTCPCSGHCAGSRSSASQVALCCPHMAACLPSSAVAASWPDRRLPCAERYCTHCPTPLPEPCCALCRKRDRKSGFDVLPPGGIVPGMSAPPPGSGFHAGPVAAAQAGETHPMGRGAAYHLSSACSSQRHPRPGHIQQRFDGCACMACPCQQLCTCCAGPAAGWWSSLRPLLTAQAVLCV